MAYAWEHPVQNLVCCWSSKAAFSWTITNYQQCCNLHKECTCGFIHLLTPTVLIKKWSFVIRQCKIKIIYRDATSVKPTHCSWVINNLWDQVSDFLGLSIVLSRSCGAHRLGNLLSQIDFVKHCLIASACCTSTERKKHPNKVHVFFKLTRFRLVTLSVPLTCLQ